jgi:hypothetical protein
MSATAAASFGTQTSLLKVLDARTWLVSLVAASLVSLVAASGDPDTPAQAARVRVAMEAMDSKDHRLAIGIISFVTTLLPFYIV